jgi:hypothetical protein
MRLRWKSSANPPTRRTATAAPTSTVGLRLTSRICTGDWGSGRERSFVVPPHSMGARPRNTKARPTVAMIMPIAGRPIMGRSTTRSVTRPSPAMTTSVIGMATRAGRSASRAAAMKAPNIMNSPWAKLMTPVAL